MNKEKILIIIAVMFLGLSLIGEGFLFNLKITQIKNNKEAEKTNKQIAEIFPLITSFGEQLQKVYLTSPTEEVKKEIQENYQDFLSPDLLNAWLNDPSKALGRVTSSPWPDHIDIKSYSKVNDSLFFVLGNIINVTSEEMVNDGAASINGVIFRVEKINGKWLITNLKIVNPIQINNNDDVTNTNIITQ